MQSRNITEFQGNVKGTRMTRLGFDGDENNQVSVDDLYYYFPIGGKVRVTVAAAETEITPKVTDSSQQADWDTSLHIEGFCRFKVTDNIAITPGLFVITNPEHNDNNDSIFVGTVRTTFKF